MATKICPVCGTEFQVEYKKGMPKKYCSDRCGRKAMNTAYTARKNASRTKTRCCAVCGKEFNIDYSAGKQREVYCSDVCRKASIREHAMEIYYSKAEQNPDYWRHELRKCAICGESFTPTNHKQIICKQDHKAICEACGQEFILPRDKKGRQYITKTCSKKCAVVLGIRNKSHEK